jgi:hypothetical protein
LKNWVAEGVASEVNDFNVRPSRHIIIFIRFLQKGSVAKSESLVCILFIHITVLKGPISIVFFLALTSILFVCFFVRFGLLITSVFFQEFFDDFTI